jgi:glutamate dehydrogenase
MPHALTKKKKQPIEAIVKSAAGKNSNFSAFTRAFYSGAPSEFLENKTTRVLADAAKDIWEFISVRTKGKSKVRVYNPSWDEDRTIVEMLTNDQPFLIDSISAEINYQGLRIYQILHPVIDVERDGKGSLKKLSDAANKHSGNFESVMQFQITYIDSEKARKSLEKELNRILGAVGVAVQDWRTMLSKIDGTIAELDRANDSFKSTEVKEVIDFFHWLKDNHFTLLGVCDFDYKKNSNGKTTLVPVKDADLGIFRLDYPEAGGRGAKILTHSILPSDASELISFSKSNRKSLVHRSVHMDYVGVKRFDKKGEVIGERRYLGLYTSSVYYQTATFIPIIRKRIEAVLKSGGFKDTSHDGKELVSILEGYPRDELFQIDNAKLSSICMDIVELAKRPRVRAFMRRDRYGRFASCIVFVPRERFNTQTREKIQSILENALDGAVIDHYTQVTDSPLARLHVIIKTDTKGKNLTSDNIAEIEKEILEITNSWLDGLRETLISNWGEKKGESHFRNFSDAFPPTYTNRYHFGGTFRDIIKIQEALEKDSLSLELYKLKKSSEGFYELKLFNPEQQVTLSEILPILENMGFHVLDELAYLITPTDNKPVWVLHFRLRIDISMNLASGQTESEYVKSLKEDFEDALFKIWHQEIEDDALNTLIIKAGMKWREVVLLRAFGRYIHQTAFSYSYDFLADALSAHPILSQKLFSYFETRFSNTGTKAAREAALKKARKNIDDSLTTVTNVAEDRVIRQYVELISATLRTNYFQKNADGEAKDYISFKFNSSKVPDLPLPRPYREVFVYSYDVEGIHLRGGKVARGGLRWSDRPEDFRTEVLGLMKAQMVKNAVIVPVGSKGGFVVKHPDKSSREAWMDQGIECYKTFLRGLLDITDNIVDGKISPPKDVLRHDDDDPYLVVAADKGTATFSDIANGVSDEYGFWLSDAFASGGSAGYDHKKMGITARGAWVSVRRHFIEMGKDTQTEDFTTIGIGDMSGDVFGNGMLLSEHIQLVGAFNHMHIFLDPTPNTEKSFKERQRLFKLPRSSWTDYDTKLISKGGGIFERTSKTIKISAEVKKVLSIKEDTLAPDDLIKAMLKAPVELLWNGGIGTYVKSSDETHEEVGDKSNDAVRISGDELQCKVMGEGGNLGFTQMGRIEFALKGGKINTDAIDNSAGVDCSDHEVNIKIALRKAQESKKLDIKARNKLLASMTDAVSGLVLRDNYLQTQTITVIEQQGTELLEAQKRLMHVLEEEVGLDRKIEFLPDDEAINIRQTMKQGLTRPEISVLLSYSKIAVYENLITSNLPDDEYFLNDLKLYFPEAMRSKFADEIESHELRREIIATVVSNSIVNRVGLKYFFQMMDDTDVKGCDVARAYTVARDTFGLRNVWLEIEKLSGKVNVETQVEMFLETRDLIELASSWFIRNSAHPLNVSTLVEKYSKGIKEVRENINKILTPSIRNRCDAKEKYYTDAGVPQKLAKNISRLDVISSACDIVHVSISSKMPVKIVGEIYHTLGTRLSLNWLREHANKLPEKSHWQRLSIKTMIEELFDEQMRITSEVVKHACKGDKCDGAIANWEEANVKDLRRYDDFIEDLRSNEKVDPAMLTVASKRVKNINALLS